MARTLSRLAPTLLAALLAATLAAAAGCGGEGAQDDGAPGDRVTPAVEVIAARSGSLPLSAELNGVVRARNQVTVRPEIAGRVTAVLVQTGDAVQAGQPLVRLDSDELAERLRQAEAAARRSAATAAEARAEVAEVEAQASRVEALHAEALVSDLELETREAQLAAARARAEQAAAEVAEARAAAAEIVRAGAKAVVRSPIAGRIGRRDVEVGMVVDPGNELFVVGDLDDLVVDVPLNEKLLARIAEGTPATVRAAALGGGAIEGELARISPFLESGSFSTTGEVDLAGDAGALRPGMFVTVELRYGAGERATLVPASALWEDPTSGELTVYVLRGGETLPPAVAAGEAISKEAYPFELRSVEVRAREAATVGIDGLAAGEWVVVTGQQLLYDVGRLGGRGGGGGSGAGGEAAARDGAREAPTARVRGADWDEVLALQDLQREDLLADFLAKQRILARELGADIPDDPTAAERVLSGVAGRDGR